MSANPTTELSVGYHPIDGAYDELFDGETVRPHWGKVARSLGDLGQGELATRASETRRLLVDDGVTYNAMSGESSVARPWVLDPVPVVLAADEWQSVEAGLVQRAELLDLLLSDLYGPRRLIDDGSIPPEVVYGHPDFLRQCDQIRLPGERQLFHAAFDLARDPDGSWVVLSDRTQAPSGMGYALENRLVVARVLPDLYRDAEVVRLAAFFRELRGALQRVAPRSADVPRIAVLTPGPWSETSYEHGSLASYLGYPLVQGPDLRVRDGRVWMRTLGRLEPVDVILRRVDPPWCDPLELRPESTLGAPGLIEACRIGSVSVVNTLGSGVLENAALLPFLPQLCEELLGEPLRLRSPETWWCGDPTSLRHVLGHLDGLVLKSIAPPGRTTLVGSELSAAELAELRSRIEAQPYTWVGQEPVELGSTPTFNGSSLEARRAVLRGFVVAGENGYTVMPGGLTRVAGQAGETMISNQNGAWSKDTWVLAREPESLTGFWLQPDDGALAIEPETAMSQRAVESLFWMSRYAERAEDLVRQIRVASDRLTEFAPGTNPAGNTCIEVLLSALTQTSGSYPGFVGDDAAERLRQPAPEMRALLVDAARQGSVAHSVRSLLYAAAQVRDQLSNDTWLVIGHLERDLGALDRQLPVAADATALGRVMGAMLALSGLSAESMVRDDGWKFLEAGRRLERAMQICSLLAATITTRRDPAADSLITESVLTAAESIVTYRRRYRSHAQVETMLDLLLLDSSNPRSLDYQVTHLAEAIGSMPDAEPALQREIDSLLDELRTTVALADTNQLAMVESDEVEKVDGRHDAARSRLWAFLVNVSVLLTRLGELLDAAHFSHQLPQRVVAPTQSFGQLYAAGGQAGTVTYRVVHRTEYLYDSTVSASYGEAHLHPRQTQSQQPYKATLTIDPFPEHYRERRDFFGNRAAYFTVLEAHDALTVVATSIVDVRDRRSILPAIGDRSWEQARDLLHQDESEEAIDARQFVLRSPAVAQSTGAVDYVKQSFGSSRPLVESLEELCARLREEFDFAPGVTTVSSPVDEVLARRAGVCQDFAHLTISGLRGLGLAARYVSGYLETVPPPGRARLLGADVSHAWVSVFVPQVGWVDLDPTNGQFVNERYVTVAWGRDYTDVPPLKGVIYTQGEGQKLEVTVDVTPIADDDPVLASVSS